jgi:kinesin family protein C1
MEATITALRTQIGNLEANVSDFQSQLTRLKERNGSLSDDNRQLQSDLREAETIRRKLHNELQELRGNIRVFVRVRPSIDVEEVTGTTTMASIRYPNEREAAQIEILASGESATGTVMTRNHQFTFDRIFPPASTQSDVFEEVAHLTQSVLDGYNVSNLSRLSLSLSPFYF